MKYFKILSILIMLVLWFVYVDEAEKTIYDELKMWMRGRRNGTC